MRISDWSSDVCSSDLAPHNLLVEILRMMLSEPFGEHRTDQSAGTSCEHGTGDNREQGSAGGHDGPHRGERSEIYDTSDYDDLGIANRFRRYKGGAGHHRIVGQNNDHALERAHLLLERTSVGEGRGW